jgi:chromatin structure-remodeling complex subunit RSC1/2
MLTNPNDAEKPIVAQIFKMWKNSVYPLLPPKFLRLRLDAFRGEAWINVCWYYRPEQTVHRSSRLFYENEVFKSGQYRDHPASQILSKTFVQFITRYTRGRPKHWPANERIWVVESRYNDITRAFSKINQWRACIPEEVRFDEDDLFLFEKQRSYERFASPLAGMLGEKVYGEGEKLPDPIEPGSDDGPPKVGAIYRGDSPEPEREPTPPPPPPPPPPVQTPTYKTPILPGGQQYRPMVPQQQQPYAMQQQQQQQRFAPTQQRQAPPPPPPSEQPLAFTMPIAVPSEVGELVARDNQGRVLWFGVPPVDIVGWGGGEGVRGHSLEYLVRKRKREEEVPEVMGEVEVSEPMDDRWVKRRASELLSKALEMLAQASQPPARNL